MLGTKFKRTNSYSFFRNECGTNKLLEQWLIKWDDLQQRIENRIKIYSNEWFRVWINYAWSYSRTFYKSLIDTQTKWHWLYFKSDDTFTRWFTITIKRIFKINL